jgi:WD40 repeat protein/serine/threonine protein kinase
VPHPSSDEVLIARLFDLPAADRPAFWQRACADDPALRTRHPEFARLFSAARSDSIEPDTALTVPPFSGDAMSGLLASALSATDHEAVGTHIGHYKLLQKIGEGGFGSVWMAEQLEPIRRRVALKILKIGMDTEEVIARFEAERQALALMDHPNIARVFDAGATAAGRPFFVMELVRGVAITRYCDENRLTAEARLRLFISVCQAVQHAHQKGIIHRDLKPSNILVTLHDGTAVPKVIDFGIAKATDKQLTEKTLVTHFHAFVGTPAYTSPEQMEMSGLDVDTRSDIYSLGVLLYELLAGRPPFDPDALMKSGLEAMRRTLRETDPPRPSHRLGTLTDADRTSVAHARGTDAAKLTLLLRGDVDWIVMHCLEKDRTRRYETANALARDVQRHLANEPVSARPPSTLYRTQKLFRRHKLAVCAAAAVAFSVVGGLIVSSTLFVSERTARRRAVAAEKAGEILRRQAEAARVEEARRASRTSLTLAEQMLADGRTAEGLAHLVRAARSDSTNTAIGPRLISALAFRSFAEPVGETLHHPAPISRVFFLQDGHCCLSVSDDARWRVWDLDSGKLLHTIDTGTNGAVDVNSDGRLFASAGPDGGVSIWNPKSGLRVLGPLRHEQLLHTVHFSPDNRRLATIGADGVARIWDVATGKLETRLHSDYPVKTIHFSPNGTQVLTTSQNGPSRVWRIPDGTPVTPNLTVLPADRGGGGATVRGSFSPDGTLLAICDQRGVQLFDAATGARVGPRMLHQSQCMGALFSCDGRKLVTGSDDGTARLWDVSTGALLLPPLPHGGKVHLLRLTPDERLLITGSLDGVARVWSLTTGQLAMEPIRVGDIRDISLAPDGAEIVTGGRDGAVRRWQLASGAAAPFQLPADSSRLLVRGENSNSAFAWTLYRDRLQQIELVTGAAVGAPRIFRVPIQESINVIFAPDHHHVAVRDVSGEMEIRDLRSGEIVRLPTKGPWGQRSGFSPDSAHFYNSDNANTVQVWRADTGARVAGPIANFDKGLSFSPDGRRLALGMADSSVTVWDLTTGLQVGEPMRHRGKISMARFSPDSRLIAVSSLDGGALLWDANTTRPVSAPLPHRSIVRGVAFTRDGHRLLTWTPLDTRVWDVATGAPLTDPMLGGNDISNAVFSDDGTRIATWDRATTQMRVWGSTSGQLLAEPVRVINAGSEPLISFVSADRFLNVTKAGRSVIWPVPPQSGHNAAPGWLLRLATAMAGGEIDARAVFREQAFDAKAFDAIRRELAALPATAPYVEWGRWLLADRATRSIAPGFTITPAEAAKFAGPDEPATDDPTTTEP